MLLSLSFQHCGNCNLHHYTQSFKHHAQGTCIFSGTRRLCNLCVERERKRKRQRKREREIERERDRDA